MSIIATIDGMSGEVRYISSEDRDELAFPLYITYSEKPKKEPDSVSSAQIQSE